MSLRAFAGSFVFSQAFGHKVHMLGSHVWSRRYTGTGILFSMSRKYCSDFFNISCGTAKPLFWGFAPRHVRRGPDEGIGAIIALPEIEPAVFVL